MLNTKRTTLVAAMLTGTVLSGQAIAEAGTVRVALKDFLSTNPNSVAHVARIEEALAERGHDIDIEIVDISSAGYADALTVKLLSGDVPDLIYFQGGDQQVADQGVLEDWRPWIEKTEYLKDALYPHNEARLENYPYLLYIYPLRGWQPVMRSDWLEASGMEAPSTLDEFTALLEVIRDGDLDGNGADDTYGFTMSETLAELDGFLDPAFGIDATWMQDDSGAWVHAQIIDAQRVKLEYYHQLFADGLLDPEYVTANWEAKEDKFYTGRAGMVSASRAENVDVYQTKMNAVHPDTTLTLLDPPEGPGGQGLQSVDVSRESRGWALSALSENKEAVMVLLDFLASPDGQFMEQFGLPGIHYEMDGDTVELLPAFGSWETPFLHSASWTPPIALLSEPGQQYEENAEEFYKADDAFSYPSDYAATVDATQNVYNAWAYRFVSGAESLDNWDSYVAEWKAAGGDRLLELAEQELE